LSCENSIHRHMKKDLRKRGKAEMERTFLPPHSFPSVDICVRGRTSEPSRDEVLLLQLLGIGSVVCRNMISNIECCDYLCPENDICLGWRYGSYHSFGMYDEYVSVLVCVSTDQSMGMCVGLEKCSEHALSGSVNSEMNSE